MLDAFTYLPERLLFRLGDFFHHWYVDGTKWYFNFVVRLLEKLDRGFAFRVTLRHFGEPLYGDYTVIGRIMGFLFRSARLLIGGAIYACLMAAFAVAAIVWFLTPPALLIYALI